MSIIAYNETVYSVYSVHHSVFCPTGSHNIGFNVTQSIRDNVWSLQQNVYNPTSTLLIWLTFIDVTSYGFSVVVLTIVPCAP